MVEHHAERFHHQPIVIPPPLTENPVLHQDKHTKDTSKTEEKTEDDKKKEEEAKKSKEDPEAASKSVDKSISGLKEFGKKLDGLIIATVSNPGIVLSSPLINDSIVAITVSVSVISSVLEANTPSNSDIFYPNRNAGQVFDSDISARLTLSDSTQSFFAFKNGEVGTYTSNDPTAYSWMAAHKGDLEKYGIRVDLKKDGSFSLTNINFKPELANGVFKDPAFASFLAGQQSSYQITDPAMIKWVGDNRAAIESKGISIDSKGGKVVLSLSGTKRNNFDPALFKDCPNTNPNMASFIKGLIPFVVGSDKSTMDWLSENKTKLSDSGVKVQMDGSGYSIQNQGFIPANISQTATNALSSIISFANLSARVAQLSVKNAKDATQRGDTATATINTNNSVAEIARCINGINLVSTYLANSAKISSMMASIKNTLTPQNKPLSSIVSLSDSYVEKSQNDANEGDKERDIERAICLQEYVILSQSLEDMSKKLPSSKFNEIKTKTQQYLDAVLSLYQNDPDRAMMIVNNLPGLLQNMLIEAGIQSEFEEFKSLGLKLDLSAQ